MKALVFTEPGRVEILEVPEPAPSEDEVVVAVERTGICGSELHGIASPGFRVPPLIMGHEFIGRTPDGRRVAVNPLLTCQQCDQCHAGRTQLCRQRALLGVHRAGGLAERVAVPRSALHDLSETISPEKAALVEPLANAVHAWSLAGSPYGARVAVVGAGPIGLCCVEYARHAAASVTCVDLAPERRAVAASLGATAVEELEGEFDVIFDAVGVPATRDAAVTHCAPGGITVWLGLASPDPGFDATALVRNEKVARGSFAYNNNEFATAVETLPALDLSWGTTYPLERGAEVFLTLMGGAATPVKALLAP